MPETRNRICVMRLGYFPADPRVRREVHALTNAGFEVDVICLRGPGQPLRERHGAIRIHRLPFVHRRSGVGRYLFEYSVFPLMAAGLAGLMHVRRHYDVVQVNSMPDHLVFAAAVPRALGAKVLFDMHEAMPELFASKFGDRRWLRRILAWVERLSIAFADQVIVVSEAHRRLISSRTRGARPFHVVLNAPDEALFGAAQPRPPEQRELTLVSHGTLVRRHGFDVAIRALATVVRREGVAARLVVIGHGEELESLRALASDLGVGDRVEFRGQVPMETIAGHIRTCDIGVVANRRDAFMDVVLPTKLMEYVAVGLPAVVSRSTAVELYFDASMVSLVRPGDPDDLAAAVCEISRNRRDAERRAVKARRKLNSEYAWSDQKVRYTQVVTALAAAEAP